MGNCLMGWWCRIVGHSLTAMEQCKDASGNVYRIRYGCTTCCYKQSAC